LGSIIQILNTTNLKTQLITTDDMTRSIVMLCALKRLNDKERKESRKITEISASLAFLALPIERR